VSLVPVVYGQFLSSLCGGEVNFLADSFKCMLLGDGYIPNQGAHQYKSQVFPEVSGSGYVAGGMAISGVNPTYTQSTKTLNITAGNLVWPTLTVAGIRYAVIFDNTPTTDASKPLVCYVDFQTDQSPSDQAFYVTWPGSGMLSLVLP
jgi:hypothetical protein